MQPPIALTDSRVFLKTENLFKSFGEVKAVENVSLNIQQGEIYGLMGLNGAGKTTLIRMLLSMIQPEKGKITLFGEELSSRFKYWNQIGYLVESPKAYPNLTVYENLSIYYKLRQLKEPDLLENIIDHLKLSRYRNTRAKTLSLGNLQRLGLAKALIHHPRLIILDEPINGLDPEGIVEIRELLLTLAQNGSAIFLSSHIIGEIAKVATRIGIIHEGKLIKELYANELNNQLTKKIIVHTRDNQKALQHLLGMGYHSIMNNQQEIEIDGQSTINHPERISEILVRVGLPPIQVYLSIEDLEMYFLRTIQQHYTP